MLSGNWYNNYLTSYRNMAFSKKWALQINFCRMDLRGQARDISGETIPHESRNYDRELGLRRRPVPGRLQHPLIRLSSKPSRQFLLSAIPLLVPDLYLC